jgi:glycosyltransferase involved in cell wall biosynthesis
MKIAIVVPVYNEEKRAVNTVNDILKVDKSSQIILVDDGSYDNSYKILTKAFAKNKRVSILQHIINLGKGAAMKTGVKKAFKWVARRLFLLILMVNIIPNIYLNLRDC